MPGENHFFEDIYADRKTLGDPQNPATLDRIIHRLSIVYGKYNQMEDQERSIRHVVHYCGIGDDRQRELYRLPRRSTHLPVNHADS